MSRRKSRGRPVHGVLLLDKPQGLTSNAALQRAKRIYGAAKAGHTGALDPLATGVLPLCFGEATKFSQYLLDSDKCYRTTYQLGAFSTTGDSEGELLDECDASAVTREDVLKALEPFRGDIMQVPPMYSALKHEGQPLYKLARAGIEVERKARPVTIYELNLLDFRPGQSAEVDLEVRCSKGTYIRSIAEDLGKSLGCGAHVTVLKRTDAGGFELPQCTSLESLEALLEDQGITALDDLLLPVDAPVDDLVVVTLDHDSAYYFSQGNPVMDHQALTAGDEGDLVRVFDAGNCFLGLGFLDDEGRVAPKRLVVM